MTLTPSPRLPMKSVLHGGLSFVFAPEYAPCTRQGAAHLRGRPRCAHNQVYKGTCERVRTAAAAHVRLNWRGSSATITAAAPTAVATVAATVMIVIVPTALSCSVCKHCRSARVTLAIACSMQQPSVQQRGAQLSVICAPSLMYLQKGPHPVSAAVETSQQPSLKTPIHMDDVQAWNAGSRIAPHMFLRAISHLSTAPSSNLLGNGDTPSACEAAGPEGGILMRKVRSHCLHKVGDAPKRILCICAAVKERKSLGLWTAMVAAS